MGSTRFPGKMLAPFAGRPLLGAVLSRVALARSLNKVVLTTSTEARDDPLAAFAQQFGVAVVRGSELDVLDRLRSAAVAHPSELMVRISGDSPLIRPDVIDLVVGHASGAFDLFTNVHPRTFPRGCSVEVFPARTLDRIDSMSPTPSDREHVTALAYRHADLFSIRSVTNPEGDESTLNLCVDFPEDLARLECLARRSV